MSHAILKHDQYKRGIHTEYLGDESAPKDDAGNHTKTKTMSFFRGKAAVDGQLRAHLKAKGLV